jgi:hypothetical protein
VTSGKPLTALALAGAIALSLLASACGGSARNGVAQVGSTPTTTSGANTGASRPRDDRNVLVAFAVCMRRHGLPNFPDPRADSNGYHLRYGAENGIDPRSSQFTNAQQACRRLLPNGGRQSSQEQAKELQAGLEYAVCMRAHGVSKFPDPKVSSDGEIEIGVGPRSHVNPASPQFKAAEKAVNTYCLALAAAGQRRERTSPAEEATANEKPNRPDRARARRRGRARPVRGGLRRLVEPGGGAGRQHQHERFRLVERLGLG